MMGNVAGKHRSPHRGSSVEFAEYRKYVAGDDTRRLDCDDDLSGPRLRIGELAVNQHLGAAVALEVDRLHWSATGPRGVSS